MAKENYQQKLDKLKRFTDQTIQIIFDEKQDYKKFLEFQARFYKYRFEDALLIYAQNPNAQACATYQQWNKEKVGRRIYKNPKTIYVFDGDNQSQIKYLFELSDTHGKPFRYPTKVTIPERYQQAVLDAFNAKPRSDDFNKNFKWCIESYVSQHYDIFMKDFELTHKNIQQTDALSREEFKRLLTDSVGFMLCQRYSIPKGIYDNDKVAFEGLGKLKNSKETAMLLGCASQEVSKRLIAYVNQTLFKEEKRLNHERQTEQQNQRNDHSRAARVRGREDNLRGTSGIGEGNGRTTAGENGQVRQDVGGLYGNGTSGEESLPIDRGATATENAGSSERSNEHDNNLTGAVQENIPTPNGEPVEPDTIQPTDDGLGGGNHVAGDSLPPEIEEQPNSNPVGTLNNQGSFYMPTAKEIAENEFYIKEALLYGTGTVDSREAIYNAFRHNNSNTPLSLLAKTCYGNAQFNHLFSNGYMAKIKSDVEGLSIDFRNTSGPPTIYLSWEHVGKGIKEQIENMDYFIRLEVDKQNSRNELVKNEPNEYEIDFYDTRVNEIKESSDNYTEPFVVFHYSPYSTIKLDEKIPFWAAEKQLQEIEANHRFYHGDTNPYEETLATIFYKDNPNDTVLSTYGLTYDLGAYSEANSGLYNHITYYWNSLENEYNNHPEMKESPFGSREQMAHVKRMLDYLNSFRNTELAEEKPEEQVLNAENQGKKPDEVTSRNDFEKISTEQEAAYIREILLYGAGSYSSREEINKKFYEEKPLYQNIHQLKSICNGAKFECELSDGNKSKVEYSDAGLNISIGGAPLIHARWEDVTSETLKLVESGDYLKTLERDAQTLVEEIGPLLRKEYLKSTRNTIEHRNYNAFNNLFPQIVDGTYGDMRYQAGEGFDPLILERLYDNRFSIKHTYKKNGDEMRDPEMEIEIDVDNQQIHALTYEQSGLGLYQSVNQGEYINRKLQKNLNSFFNQWLKNIKEQGYLPERASSRQDERLEYYFDNNGNLIEKQEETGTIRNVPEPDSISYEEQTENTVPENEIANPNEEDTQGQPAQEEKVPPAPLFFESWKDVDGKLDYSLYNDGDVIGYDKKGVQYKVHFSNTHTFINSETAITPWGEVLGFREIPEDILEKIKASNDNNTKEENTWIDKTDNVPETQNTPTEKPNTETNHSETALTNDTAENFTIHTETDIGLASGKTKYWQNVEAITLLKQIESDNRLATAEEQKILAKYSGFGGIPQAFADDNEQWTKEYQELKELLTPGEYSLARASTLNAHFTGADITKAMYDGIKRLGFQGGNILEPAMGTGNFFGTLPEDLKDKTQLYGVELDEITGRIAKQLYPKADIEINGFQDTKNPDNFFDLAIGNVPFGNYKVPDTKFNQKNFLIHDYFFAKTLDKVKPNGVIAFVTSKGTLDKANPSFRRYIAERAELLGAIRLPNNAFKQSANTDVTTDILFLKKRDRIIDASEENWIYTGYYPTTKKTDEGIFESVPLNQYYIDNPHMMLGEMQFDKSMYGNDNETALFPFSKPDNLAPEEHFTDKFAQLRQTKYFSEKQREWLDKFETNAKANGYFTRELLETSPAYAYYGGFKRLNEIFDNRLQEIINFVSLEQQDKSEIPLKDLLAEAIEHLPENILEEYATLEDLEVKDFRLIPATSDVKNYSYTVVNDMIYQRENSLMHPLDLPEKTQERVKMLIELRDMTKYLIHIQLENCPDSVLKEVQEELNDMYDTFTKKFKTNINTPYNVRLFGDDAEFPLVSSLEEIKDDGTIEKADIFSKRTIQPYHEIERVETSVEALTVSLYNYGSVDIEYMANLVQKDPTEVIQDLQGIIFKDPIQDNLDQSYDILKNWETADQYLCGNVVEKLELAKEYAKENKIYLPNIKALEDVQPTPLEAHEISAGIGSRWIDEKYYKQFIEEHFNPDSEIKVSYSNLSNRWRVTKPRNRNTVFEAVNVYGTSRLNAYEIMDTLLNQRRPKVFDKIIDADNKEKRILNKKETLIAKEAAKKMQSAFQNWIFDDPDRREVLVEKYNKLYNSERVRQYDGSFLLHKGMNPLKKLRDYQNNAVARILFGGNTLLAHVVGAGKTYTMIAAGMEMRRLGLANKPMYVVPNHLVNQWANEFKALYPTANILAATKKDFEKGKRQRFCARAATGDWDAVIIGHSSFGMIPVSQKRQEAKLQHDIKVARDGLAEAKKDKSEKTVIKEIERNIRSLEYKLKKLMDKPKDNVIDFENLGVDALFVDEADEFKNKFVFTKMGQIAGLSKTASDKSTDMELKCNYINEINGSERNVVFATGTPISNSMVECFTMQSYLMKKELEKLGLEYFDNWAAQFGEVITSLELDVSGKGFKMRDRFAKFKNVPDLMNLFRMIADIQTAEMLKLPVPEIEGGKPTTIAVEASPSQKALVDALVELSYKISQGDIPPEHYNMLCVTNDGRLGALDMRTVNIEKFKKLAEMYDIDIEGIAYEDFINSKVNECVNNVYNIYKDTAKDKLTQMIFCDISTPKNNNVFDAGRIKEQLSELCTDWGKTPEETTAIQEVFLNNTATKTSFSSKKMSKKLLKLCSDNGLELAESKSVIQQFLDDVLSVDAKKQFSVYNDIKEKLIRKGVSPDEVAFIHDANSDDEKEELFRKMRSGELRVLLGSTARMGAGTNAQKKLYALHHLDCPWRPRDLSQREGRIVRFGNENPMVKIFNYVTKGTFDSYMWQLVEIKQRMINQIMSGKVTSRTFEDVDTTTLNYAEVKAIATGNPNIKRKMELESEIQRLKTLEQDYIFNKYRLQDRVFKQYPQKIARLEKRIEILQRDIATRNENKTEDFSMQLGKKIYSNKEIAIPLLIRASRLSKYADKEIGSYNGFKIQVGKQTDFTEPHIILQGAVNHKIIMHADEASAFREINRVLNKLDGEIDENRAEIKKLTEQIEVGKIQLEKPFENADDLKKSVSELDNINSELDIDKDDYSALIDEDNVSSDLANEFQQDMVIEEETFEEELEIEIG